MSRETSLVHDALMNYRSETSIVNDAIMNQYRAEKKAKEELKKATLEPLSLFMEQPY